MTEPSPALVRAMANTLLDHDVDPYDRVEVITTLITAGFTAKQIETNYNAATSMASIRRHNDA